MAHQNETLEKLATPIAIVIAGGLIAAAVYFVGSQNAGTVAIGAGSAGQVAGAAQLVTTAAQMKTIIAGEKFTNAYLDPSASGSADTFIGNVNAPVTMTYWFDYQCPFCKQFETTVMPTLVEQYVNTGKLKIVFKSFPFLGNDSTIAAEYAKAIWELYPTKFYQWHTDMFVVQDAEGDTGFGDAKTIDTLISLIPGLDDGKIKAAITANKARYDQEIAAEQKDGGTNGVTGTPGFIVGKQLIAGAEPLASFTQVIDAALKGK